MTNRDKLALKLELKRLAKKITDISLIRKRNRPKTLMLVRDILKDYTQIHEKMKQYPSKDDFCRWLNSVRSHFKYGNCPITFQGRSREL